MEPKGRLLQGRGLQSHQVLASSNVSRTDLVRDCGCLGSVFGVKGEVNEPPEVSRVGELRLNCGPLHMASFHPHPLIG